MPPEARDHITTTPPHTEYDPRYLRGIDLFNDREFFEAHEVWEDLWHDTAGTDRRWYQALIQAAVALHHAENGNLRGTRRMAASARNYMSAYPAVHLGIDVRAFWEAVAQAMTEFLADPPAEAPRLNASRIPRLPELPGDRGGAV